MGDSSLENLIQPQSPHDDLAFAELAAAYNFRNISCRSRLFVRLLIKELAGRTGPIRALDIGCGNGISTGKNAQGYLRAFHQHVDELWGVEPDQSITPTHDMFTRFQHALIEDADLPSNYFALAYSFMVMEHVADPQQFLTAVHRCLKPGGVYLFVTPNGAHYFTRIASLLHHLHLDKLILRMLVGKKSRSIIIPCNIAATDRDKSPHSVRRLTLTRCNAPLLKLPAQHPTFLARYDPCSSYVCSTDISHMDLPGNTAGLLTHQYTLPYRS